MSRPNLYGKQGTSVVSVRLPNPLKKRLEQIAEIERRSVNQMIVLLLEQAAQQYVPRPPESTKSRPSR